MKKLAAFIIAISLLIGVGAALFYSQAKKRDFYFDNINALIEQETGYVISKSDPLEFSLFPSLTLSASNLILSNPAAPAKPKLAQVNRLTLILQWASLLRFEPVVDLELEDADFDLEIDQAGKNNWMTEELKVIGSGPPFDLDNIDASNTRLRFEDHQSSAELDLILQHTSISVSDGESHATIDSAGQIEGTLYLATGEAEFNANNHQLDLNLDIDAMGAHLSNQSNGSGLPSPTGLAEESTHYPLHGVIRGSINTIDGVPLGSLKFQASARDFGSLAYLAPQLEYLRQEAGPISATGILKLNGSDLDIEDFSAKLQDTETVIKATGSLHDLMSHAGVNIDLKAQAKSLDTLIKPGLPKEVLNNLVVGSGPVSLSASIDREEGTTVFSDLALKYSHSSIRTELDGELRLSKEDVQFNFKQRSEISDVSGLFLLLDVDESEWAILPPFRMDSTISGDRDNLKLERASLRAIDDSFESKISGEIGWPETGLNFDLDSKISFKSIFPLADFFPQELQEHIVNADGSASAKITGNLEQFSVNELDVDLRRDSETIRLRGHITNLPDDPSPAVDINYRTNNLVFPGKHNKNLEEYRLAQPLDFTATLKTAGQQINIQNISLQIDDSDLSGDITLDLAEKPPRIAIKLKSNRLSLGHFQEVPEAGPEDIETAETNAEITEAKADSTSEKTHSEQQAGEIFKSYLESVNLETNWINEVELAFRLEANEINTGNSDHESLFGEIDFKNLVLIVDISEGLFILESYERRPETPPLLFNVSINSAVVPPEYRFSGSIETGSLENLLQLEDGLLIGGNLAAKYNLVSQGDDLGELFNNLSGDALFKMGPMTIKSGLLNSVSSDILSSILGGITRSGEDQDSSHYDCGVLGVDIKNGIATAKNTFTMQSSEYNLAGKGQINLNTGFVDVLVVPKPRKGFGFNVSNLVGGFKINGNLATPSFGTRGGQGLVSAAVTGYLLAPAAVAGTTAVTGAAAVNPVTAAIIASGYVATGLVNRITASNFTCENTLKRYNRNRSQEDKSRSGMLGTDHVL